MNTSNSETDVPSLASRIKKIEEEQNLRRQNIAWLKTYFDALKQEFNSRPELEQIQSMQNAIAQLSAKFIELQQHFQELLNLSNKLNHNSAQEEHLNNSQIIKQFFETDELETEQEEQIDLAEEQENFSRVFSDREFQIERIMWLVNRIYAVEEPSNEIPVDVEEFLIRYNAGERDFTGINLAGVNLSGKTLNKINLSNANLSGANISHTNLDYENLSNANLRGADLSEADLSGANLTGANLDNACLHKTKLKSAKLENATFKKANLSRAFMYEVNLSGANLSGANFSGANLKEANLIRAWQKLFCLFLVFYRSLHFLELAAPFQKFHGQYLLMCVFFHPVQVQFQQLISHYGNHHRVPLEYLLNPHRFPYLQTISFYKQTLLFDWVKLYIHSSNCQNYI